MIPGFMHNGGHVEGVPAFLRGHPRGCEFSQFLVLLMV